MDSFLYFDELLQAEEKLIRDSVRQFVKVEILPSIMDAYEQGEFPQGYIAKLADMGLLGMSIPIEYGGGGLNAVSYGLVCQELEYGDSAIRSFVSVQSSLCMYPIYAFGNEQQKRHYLPLMSQGTCIGCFGLTEANSGSDPGSMNTHAEKVKDGWVLNGSKMWITNAPIADMAIVWAKTVDGVRGFIVEKTVKGFSRNTIKHKGSLRASMTGELVFDNCFIPEEQLLPGSAQGLSAALSCLTQARFGIAWGAMGAALACYERALNYCKQRKQFNKPLAAFQLVQKDLVDMYLEIVKAQYLNLQLAHLKDNNKAHYSFVSLAKMNACKEALKIARMARNLLGANGISYEFDVIRHMNNLESVFTYEGTDNIHHLIVGKAITGSDAFGAMP